MLGFRSFSQGLVKDPAVPRVHIIGLIHSENQLRNADSLVTLLKMINPDLILLETDTLSGYFGQGYRLRKPSWWYKLASKLRLVKKIPPEMEAMYRYKLIEPTVSLLPFDLAIPNRRKYVKQSNKAELDLMDEINRSYELGKLPMSMLETHKKYIHYDNWLYDIRHKGYQDINQVSVTDSLRMLMTLEYTHFTALFDSIPQFARHRQLYEEGRKFWDTRNRKMAENIVSLVEFTGCRRVVVLTGLLHKYFLEDVLEASSQHLLLVKQSP